MTPPQACCFARPLSFQIFENAGRCAGARSIRRQTAKLRDVMAWVPTAHVSKKDVGALKGRLEAAAAALVGNARADSIAAGAGSVREVASLLRRLVGLSSAAEAELQNAAASG